MSGLGAAVKYLSHRASFSDDKSLTVIPSLPGTKLLKQLKDGGRLVAIIAQSNFGEATLFRNSGGRVSHRSFFDASAQPLPGFEREQEFVF